MMKSNKKRINMYTCRIFAICIMFCMLISSKCYADNFIWPLDMQKNIVTSLFGMRWGSPHNGWDISVASRTASTDYFIYAVGDGEVKKAELTTNGYGNQVKIEHTLENGGKLYSSYNHMRTGSLLVSPGDKVKKGAKIGVMGSTGTCVGTYNYSTSIYTNANFNYFSAEKGSDKLYALHLHFYFSDTLAGGTGNDFKMIPGYDKYAKGGDYKTSDNDKAAANCYRGSEGKKDYAPVVIIDCNYLGGFVPISADEAINTDDVMLQMLHKLKGPDATTNMGSYDFAANGNKIATNLPGGGAGTPGGAGGVGGAGGGGTRKNPNAPKDNYREMSLEGDEITVGNIEAFGNKLSQVQGLVYEESQKYYIIPVFFVIVGIGFGIILKRRNARERINEFNAIWGIVIGIIIITSLLIILKMVGITIQ